MWGDTGVVSDYYVWGDKCVISGYFLWGDRLEFQGIVCEETGVEFLSIMWGRQVRFSRLLCVGRLVWNFSVICVV